MDDHLDLDGLADPSLSRQLADAAGPLPDTNVALASLRRRVVVARRRRWRIGVLALVAGIVGVGTATAVQSRRNMTGVPSQRPPVVASVAPTVTEPPPTVPPPTATEPSPTASSTIAVADSSVVDPSVADPSVADDEPVAEGAPASGSESPPVEQPGIPDTAPQPSPGVVEAPPATVTPPTDDGAGHRDRDRSDGHHDHPSTSPPTSWPDGSSGSGPSWDDGRGGGRGDGRDGGRRGAEGDRWRR